MLSGEIFQKGGDRRQKEIFFSIGLYRGGVGYQMKLKNVIINKERSKA
jgi:hypothetical protein